MTEAGYNEDLSKIQGVCKLWVYNNLPVFKIGISQVFSNEDLLLKGYLNNIELEVRGNIDNFTTNLTGKRDSSGFNTNILSIIPRNYFEESFSFKIKYQKDDELVIQCQADDGNTERFIATLPLNSNLSYGILELKSTSLGPSLAAETTITRRKIINGKNRKTPSMYIQ